MERFFQSAFVAVAIGGTAAAAAAQDAGPGEAEFRLHCAACHGIDGRGDGPVAAVLSAPPKNLARLAADNGGAYPFERVYRVIDGRQSVEGHGTEDMPIWGARYSEDAIMQFGPSYYPIEGVVQGRILSLVYYIQSLQAEAQ